MATYISNLVSSMNRRIPARVQEYRGNLSVSSIDISGNQFSAFAQGAAGDLLVLAPIKLNTTLKNFDIIFADAGDTGNLSMASTILLKNKDNTYRDILPVASRLATTVVPGNVPAAGVWFSLISYPKYPEVTTGTIGEFIKLQNIALTEDEVKTGEYFLGLLLLVQGNAYNHVVLVTTQTVEATPSAIGKKATYAPA
ncbi:MAG: hypothetical protein LBJ80_00115 [Rickettsiales bacterium]|jgi:hypothetical protein|nr:hypothetical protein [Rickettsiales bacterium]